MYAARQREETAPPLKGIGELNGCDTMGYDPCDGSRIHIARARRHHESFGWGEAHGGVDRNHLQWQSQRHRRPSGKSQA